VQATVRRVVLAISLVVLLTPAWSATSKAPRRTHHVRHGRRIRWNPLFRPSRESLLKQNAEIDRLELPRIQDDDELEDLKAKQQLVAIQSSEYLRFDPRLDPARRYCRPWTRDFLEDMGQAFHKEFGTSIQVNSAVRTVKIQKKLRRRNRNAAPAEGETASSHLAGVTVDIQRRGLSRPQVKWMQHYLLKQRVLGLIEPEEERRQWVFHVMVSDRYTDWRQARNAQIVESLDDPQASAASSLIQLDASQ
jgi:uncharacterized protein DUF5715